MKSTQDDKRLRTSITKTRAEIAFMMTLIRNWSQKHCEDRTSWPMLGDLNGVHENLVEILVRITYDGNSEETTRQKILEMLKK